MQTLLLPSAAHIPSYRHRALMDVLRANSASIREVIKTPETCNHTDYFETTFCDTVQDFLGAAPQLRVFRTDVEATVREATRMLRNEAPYGALRVHFLCVANEPRPGAWEEEEEPDDDAALFALADAIRGHNSLKGVCLQDVSLDTPAVLSAVVEAALERRLVRISFRRCKLSPASAPALARLLGSTALTRLIIIGGDGRELLDAGAAALFADALRANATLCYLTLFSVDVWRDANVGAAVMGALVAHPSLQLINLCSNPVQVDAVAVVGAALGALVAANAPALHDLNVGSSVLGDAGLAPLVEALRSNTHLRELYCDDNDMSAAFARDRFLPAIRANTSLRMLVASDWWGGEVDGVAPEEVLEAEALVDARTHGQLYVAAASRFLSAFWSACRLLAVAAWLCAVRPAAGPGTCC
jgi:hypothetical protein